MRTRPSAAAVAVASLALLLVLPASPATAGHYGVDTWMMQPNTVHDADPVAGSANALRSDGRGRYLDTPDTYAHVNDWSTTGYEDHFLFRDQKGTKRWVRLDIPGVTNGTVSCAKNLFFDVYGWGDDHWFNNLGPGETQYGYGSFSCYVDDRLSFGVTYPERTWCLTISRLDTGTDGTKTFRFSAPEGCLADVVRVRKTGKSTYTRETFAPMPVPFDVDSVTSRIITT